MDIYVRCQTEMRLIMKVIWLTNFTLPIFAEALNIEKRFCEGWLVGLSRQLAANSDIELVIVFPQSIQAAISKGEADNIRFYGYPLHTSKIAYNPNIRDYFSEILQMEKPDVIHIMGSEYPHCYSMIEACLEKGLITKTVISIQGMVSVIVHHYDLGLPKDLLYKKTIRDVVRRDALINDKTRLEQRGKYEVLALIKARNVIGRTDWDKACTKQINPNINYFFNNETLRPSFYGKRWRLSECEPHSIFVSQGGNIIKGLHFALMALPLILKEFPDAKLYIAGSEVLKKKRKYPRWRRLAYENYIFDLISNNHLQNTVIFCGNLNEEQMCESYLRCNVFVSPSVIENSPNSIGEAMLMGVPVVASDVGGVKNLLVHNLEGYIYQCDAYYMLAYYVCKVFDDQEQTLLISANAAKHAGDTHDPVKNMEQLISIYTNISLDNK